MRKTDFSTPKTISEKKIRNHSSTGNPSFDRSIQALSLYKKTWGASQKWVVGEFFYVENCLHKVRRIFAELMRYQTRIFAKRDDPKKILKFWIFWKKFHFLRKFSHFFAHNFFLYKLTSLAMVKRAQIQKISYKFFVDPTPRNPET